MSQATLVSPSDIKRTVGPFKSILGTCPAKQAGQQITAGQLTGRTIGHQQATACQHWAELGRSADQAKNPAKTGQNQARSKGKNALHMTLYIFSEKSIIKLFYYCIYTALYNYSTTFSLLYMYSNTKSLHEIDDFLAFFSHVRESPPCQKF